MTRQGMTRQGATLHGATLLMSGGSRGIGFHIAERAAREGANIVLLAKTDAPDPRLEGTIHSAVAALRDAGGNAIGVVGDVRDDDAIERAVNAAVEAFGAIDIVVNNASVLTLTGTLETSPKRYDLMQDVNARGTYRLTAAALPHLLRTAYPRVVSLSPPINLDSPYWLGRFPAYMMAKYAMTLATLGIAAEFADRGISANCLWPRTTIATAAVSNVLGGEAGIARSRRPDIVADAAHALLTSSRRPNGETLIDDEVLRAAGATDLSQYSVTEGAEDFDGDFFL